MLAVLFCSAANPLALADISTICFENTHSDQFIVKSSDQTLPSPD
jgi:hypothetical protein